MRLTAFRAWTLGLLLATLVAPTGELAALARQEKEKQQQEGRSQEAPPRQAISVEVPLVNVDVVVTDNNGNFIPNLKRENFRILEDGVPQTVTNFAPTEAPITIVVLIEFSRLAWQYFAYKSTTGAYDFLRYLSKDDWVALVSFDLKTRIEVDFTKNKHQVQQHLAGMYVPMFREANLVDALIETVDRLKDVRGKKSILILASGYDTFSKRTLDDALKTLRQSDVTIFAVGVGRYFFEYYDARGGYDGPWGGAARTDYYQAENRLGSFSRMTGGRAWFPRFDGQLPNIFREVAAMLRNQYSLGYSPANTKRDGKTRKIKVQLVDRDGNPLQVVDQNGKQVKYVVYAREGYTLPKGGVGD